MSNTNKEYVEKCREMLKCMENITQIYIDMKELGKTVDLNVLTDEQHEEILEIDNKVHKIKVKYFR